MHTKVNSLTIYDVQYREWWGAFHVYGEAKDCGMCYDHLSDIMRSIYYHRCFRCVFVWSEESKTHDALKVVATMTCRDCLFLLPSLTFITCMKTHYQLILIVTRRPQMNANNRLEFTHQTRLAY